MLGLAQLSVELGPSDDPPVPPPLSTARQTTVEDAAARQVRRRSSLVPSGYPNPFAAVGAAEKAGSGPRSRQTAIAPETLSRTAATVPETVMSDVRLVSVTGSLFDVDGFPIGGERVYLSSEIEHSHRSTLSGSDGVFAFPDVRPADSYRLAVVPARRYRRHSVDPFVVDEWQTPVILVLDAFPTGSVAGSVVDASGFSVARMNLVVYSAAPGTSSFKVETDTGGRFVAEDVAVGRVTFAVDAPAYVPIHTMTLDADELADVRIVLDPRWHSIHGKVSDGDGSALGGVALCLTVARAPPPTSVERCPKTDADGTFSLHLPAFPPYDLLIGAPGFERYSQTVESTDDYLGIYLDASIRDRERPLPNPPVMNASIASGW